MTRVLELFSGTKSVSKVCREHGYETLSLDLDPAHSPDLHMDILDFVETDYPRDYFQFIWASPPCESYSSARTVAKLDREAAMQRADGWVGKMLQIIEYFHEADWAVENPALSRLWRRPIASELLEKSYVTSYCAFGYKYRKNTRIACSRPLSLPMCRGQGKCSAMIGSRHLEHAQKGGGGATNAYHTVDQLHSIPPDLISLILSQLLPLSSPTTPRRR